MNHIIEMQTDGFPVYLIPERINGGGGFGWGSDKNRALHLSTLGDAQRFIDALLPGMAHTCRPVPHERA